jgi:acetyltransferase-like isoleucine patch superfamily enzyme
MISLLLKIFNPSRVVAIHRELQFRVSAICGIGFKATERSNFFPHKAPRSSIRIGAYACIDGTVEVYDHGMLTVGKNFFLGRSRIYCSSQMVIGDYVLISDNVSIMDSDLHPLNASSRRASADEWALGRFPGVHSDTTSSSITIEDDVWIGFGASVLKGVTIGRGAIVGAGSIVTSDVPPWTVVVGAPARVIRELQEHER